jgi:hypothetical protein
MRACSTAAPRSPASRFGRGSPGQSPPCHCTTGQHLLVEVRGSRAGMPAAPVLPAEVRTRRRSPGRGRLRHGGACLADHDLVLLHLHLQHGREASAVGQVSPWPAARVITTRAGTQDVSTGQPTGLRCFQQCQVRILAAATAFPGPFPRGRRPIPGWLGQREVVRAAGPELWLCRSFRTGPDFVRRDEGLRRGCRPWQSSPRWGSPGC